MQKYVEHSVVCCANWMFLLVHRKPPAKCTTLSDQTFIRYHQSLLTLFMDYSKNTLLCDSRACLVTVDIQTQPACWNQNCTVKYYAWIENVGWKPLRIHYFVPGQTGQHFPGGVTGITPLGHIGLGQATAKQRCCPSMHVHHVQGSGCHVSLFRITLPLASLQLPGGAAATNKNK